MRAGREGEGDRCVYVPLVAPPPPQRPGQMPVTLILEKAETETKGNQRTRDGGRERKMQCDGMKFDLKNLLNKNQ